MNRQEFEELELQVQQSELPLKSYLQQIGVSYSTYHYWRRKCSVDRSSIKHELAPISFKQAFTESSQEEQLPHGVALLFPNGLRAHFGSGSEDLLKEIFTQSLRNGHVNLNDTMRYFLCPGRTDMRKGISSLCGVVHEKMNSEVRNGDVFIFIGSSRRLMKLLHAEDGGMVMYVKRLEAGRFKLPEYDPKSNSYPMEWRDLVMMVEGIQENPEQRLRRLRAERKEYHV